MSKARTLADFVSSGNPLADGTVDVSDINGVTATTAELNYTDGVTGNIQTQLDNKAPSANPTFTGVLTYNTLNDGTTSLTATAAELNYVDGVTSNIQTQLDAKVDLTGDTMTGDLSFGDNNKAIFGAGSDLQIYHDGADSYIQDYGVGLLRLKSNGTKVLIETSAGNVMAEFINNGNTVLYSNNAERLRTNGTGIDVTGTVAATAFTGDGSGLTGINTNPYDSDTSSTGYFDLPSGTTAQRPSSPNTGYVRYNTTEGAYEVYDGLVWTRLSTSSYPYTFDYIVVAGGGGGGVSISGFETGAGGGAGGYLTGTVNVSPPASYAITIGGGGAGAAGTARSSNGNTSSFGSLTSTVGGGGGAGRTSSPSNYGANSGGSGGGGSGWNNMGGAAGTSGQGNSGGNGTNSDGGTDRNGAGGGGGKGASGGNASGRNGGNGGIGSQWLDGNYYAGGGGGAGGDSGGTGGTGGGGNGRGGTGDGFAATANTGGGGGGGRLGSAGGNGGSGVVIIRYSGSQKGSGGTVTSSGGYTYHTFTTSGTYTA